MRRIVKGQDLYQINTLVDLINLTSLRWGYSIGGFDEERTSIQISTIHLLMVIYAFGRTGSLQECIEYATRLLNRHAGATSIHMTIL